MWNIVRLNEGSATEFLKRRMIRIVPLYWIVTTVIVSVMVFFPHLVQTGRFDARHIMASYFFIPTNHPVAHRLAPVLMPGWTLNIEVFFYLIMAVGLCFRPRQRGYLLVIFATILMAIRFVMDEPSPIYVFYASNFLLEFVFGVGLCMAFHRGVGITGPIALLALGAGLVAMIWRLHIPILPRMLDDSIPAALCVSAAILYERGHGLPRIVWLAALGRACYSIYLTHTIVLSGITHFARQIDLVHRPVGLALLVVAAVGGAIGTGYVVHVVVETPLMGFLNRMFPRRTALSGAMPHPG